MFLWILAIGAGIALLFVFRGLATFGASDAPKLPSAYAPSSVAISPVSSERLAADRRFRSKGGLLSAAEASFFGVLKTVLGNEYWIFAKVRIADVLEPVQG